MTIAVSFILCSFVAFTPAQTADPATENSSKDASADANADGDRKKDKRVDAATLEKETFNIAPPVENIPNPFSTVKSEKLSAPKKQTSGSDIQYAFAPYLFASGFSGTIGARGRTVEVDASFADVLKNLELGVMGTFEAKKGKLIFVGDLIWTRLSAERNTPGGAFNTAEVDVNLFIFDPEIGYRVYESQKGSFDLLGGVRIWSVKNRLDVTSGTLPGFEVEQRKTFAAPVVGFHGILNLSPKFFLSTKFDIGGGLGPDFTTQFYGGVGYRIKPNIALIGGYRFMKVDYDDETGFVYNTNMSGLLFGAKFNF